MRTALLGLVGSSAIVVGAVLGGQSFETHLAGAWFFGMPGGPVGSFGSNSPLPTIASLALVFGGLILLSRVWLGFLRHLNGHHGFPVKRVVLVVAIWAVPLLLAPPLFSRDVYTYSAQGEMMSHHINPYSYGPEVLGATPFNQMADTVWSGTESPYGPTFLSVDGLLDQASGHQILPDLVLLRLLEVAGLAMVVAATPTLARSLKHDPAHAVLIGVGVTPRAAVVGRGRAQRRPDGRPADGGTGRGQTVRHGARGDPVCACRGGEVPRAARCALPRLGLGRAGGFHPAPHRAYRRGRV